VNGYREGADLFKKAVLWLEERGGEDAVMRAFGDPVPLEAAWQLELSEFKKTLQALAREALAAERKGAA
jgi:hypothetical protein